MKKFKIQDREAGNVIEWEELNVPKELTSKNFPVTCKIINYRF